MKRGFPAAYLLPVLALTAVVWLLPLLYAIGLACTDAAPGAPGRWLGAANFLRALNDARFGHALLTGLLYAGGAVVLNVGVGLSLALALRRTARARAIAQTLLLLPWVLAELAVALIWRGFLAEDGGWVNLTIAKLGGAALPWRTDPFLAMLALWIATLWQGLAFSTLLQMAGIGALPEHHLHAAKLDGAARWLIFRAIVWPHQRRVIAVNALLVFLFSLTSFALPFALTGGGPLFATEVPALYAYQTAFAGRFELGYAATQGMIILLGCAVLIAVLLRLRRRTA